jgi:uncharacterized protein YndB with AHSA1/START domain
VTLVQREIEVDAPRQRVWAVLTDFARMPEWFLGVARLEVFGGPIRAGTERRLTLIHRQSHRERIGAWEPGKFFSVVVLDPPHFTTEWTGRISLDDMPCERSSAQPRGTVLLRWEMEWSTRFGWAGAAFDRALVRPVVDLALRLSLTRFKLRVEGQA